MQVSGEESKAPNWFELGVRDGYCRGVWENEPEWGTPEHDEYMCGWRIGRDDYRQEKD
jgi:hypothetical protein